MSIDRLDLKIIRSLSGNARKPFKTIAKEIDVSDATVRKRVKRMLEDGVIKQFNLLLDYHKLGRIIKAFIGLQINPQRLKPIVEHLKGNPDIQVLYRTTGNVNLFLEVIFRDMEELNDFLETELSVEGIIGTEVSVVIGPYKRCPCTGL
ncbi:Lrp/AsnC family transcriptional regulator [Candidatus Bathyarchaeota archaeon]|nr:Lrp/AsnC family transcriptional regulator [Candidatus Bathyarchaeota archaeon]MBL7078716.1 Lrp/AsnC family transcriptional regulator [Candidatus Bathyarchaeota archaeon]